MINADSTQLQVGEWRGFLSDIDKKFIEEQGLEELMYKAYLCTTVSTVVAMIASFFGSQHTFCYLQVYNVIISFVHLQSNQSLVT